MPTVEARVGTERPARYLVQLCKHFSNKGRHLGRGLHGHSGGDTQALREMRAVAEQAQVEWSDTEGRVVLPWGRIELRAAPGALVLRVEAAAEGDLSRLQELAGGHLERFGRRDGLRVSWRSAASPADSPATATATVPPTPTPTATASSGEAAAAVPQVPGAAGDRRRGHLKAAGVVAVVVIALAAHLGLGSVLVSHWRWTGWAVGGLVVIVLLKAALLGGFAVRRGRVPKGR
ncbi:DUF2218 domain-containing protein [Streptomyces sp. S.PB5]|uniref:DUF2218 domain-containing protein n=1 Tax=Streptomyces sp. S.PB5 TaxID=3020844 RepID=UPI0025B0E92F|nr:DUF2218 domain-containing protein [Streptomyces sp. S.PB5]MDN3021408.1 DUF2218 domain-containing protein [Streptomyces sp. S.PB5]